MICAEKILNIMIHREKKLMKSRSRHSSIFTNHGEKAQIHDSGYRNLLNDESQQRLGEGGV